MIEMPVQRSPQDRRSWLSRLTVEPRVTWGEIGMFIGGLLATLAFAWNLKTGLENLTVDLGRVDARYAQEVLRLDAGQQQTLRDIRTLEQETSTRREMLRQEIKSDLNRIDAKLDRLLEREVGKSGH